MGEIVFVGNAPVPVDISDQVDGADHVVRFNKTRGFGGWTGRRVDDLFLVNCGGQAHEWLHDRAFWTSAPLRAAGCVSLPVANPRIGSGLAAADHAPMPDPDGINYEQDMRRRLAARSIPVRVLPDAVRRSAVAELIAIGPPPEGPIWPSTGFLALYWYDLTMPSDLRFRLHGFRFTGWQGHAWDRERAWVEHKARTGRLRLDDPVLMGAAGQGA